MNIMQPLTEEIICVKFMQPPNCTFHLCDIFSEPAIAVVDNPVIATQYHAQDEFGQYRDGGQISGW